MKAFRFPLESALRWRRSQCDLELAAAQRLLMQRAQLAEAYAQAGAERTRSSEAILAQPSEFETIAVFHGRIERGKALLHSRQIDLEPKIAAQLQRTVEAQRKVKLMERLRETRLAQWNKQRDVEDEAFAAEAWLSRAGRTTE